MNRSLRVFYPNIIFKTTKGYARDVIDVVEDDTGNIVKALLYRGTPDNPAFWKRVYLDLPLAAGEFLKLSSFQSFSIGF